MIAVRLVLSSLDTFSAPFLIQITHAEAVPITVHGANPGSIAQSGTPNNVC